MNTPSLLCLFLLLASPCLEALLPLRQKTAEKRNVIAPSGANFSPCLDQSQCLPNRNCLALVSVTAPARCTAGKYCACVPEGEGSWRCSADGSCDEFETCLPMPDIFPPDRVCVDNSQIDTVRDLLFCDNDSVCERTGRICVILEDGFGFCAAPPPSVEQTPVEDEQPVRDDELAGDDEAVEDENPIEVEEPIEEEEAGPAISPADEELDDMDATAEQEAPSATACIAAHHLNEYRTQKALLYADDVNAFVLCDADNNCATEGHMVLFHERAMMMKSYCATVGCERRLMRVNSLRWSRAATVASHTKELQFSAFSARFATRVEEVALSAAIRLGL